MAEIGRVLVELGRGKVGTLCVDFERQLTYFGRFLPLVAIRIYIYSLDVVKSKEY